MNNPDPAEPGDAKLMVQQLFVRHQGAIKGFILSLRPDFAAADDILQETFLTVTLKADQFKRDTNFIAWAFTIARFKVLEAGRANRRETDLSDAIIDTLAAEAPAEPVAEARVRLLIACLDKLAPRAREMVRLRYHEEQAPEEIARRLSWKTDAVHVALSRARNLLRTCVERNAGGAA